MYCIALILRQIIWSGTETTQFQAGKMFVSSREERAYAGIVSEMLTNIPQNAWRCKILHKHYSII